MKLAEGKTKIITPLPGVPGFALVTSKDGITAGDGAKRHLLPGKGALATRTTCNVFDLLPSKGVPVAYVGRGETSTTFITRICEMIPVEVVVRRVATGSFLKRYPRTPDGTVLGRPVVEFFYKTSGRRVGDQELPCDDPLMVWNIEGRAYDLYLPNKPEAEGHICQLKVSGQLDLYSQLKKCAEIATVINYALYNAWRAVGGELYDFKVEFGTTENGEILLADVIDCDSWRVVWQGLQLSKQGYRDGDDPERVLSVYRLAAALSDRFV